MISRMFYAPGDWLAERSTARQRRALAAWALIIWIFPGLPLWLYFRNTLWFVGFMSIVALWWTGWTTVAAETPVEREEKP